MGPTVEANNSWEKVILVSKGVEILVVNSTYLDLCLVHVNWKVGDDNFIGSCGYCGCGSSSSLGRSSGCCCACTSSRTGNRLSENLSTARTTTTTAAGGRLGLDDLANIDIFQQPERKL